MIALREPVERAKLGKAWTNDLGLRFPAAPLYRYECPCGWRGAAWYMDRARAKTHFDRHVCREAQS